jgi:AbiV family abortive infection protein
MKKAKRYYGILTAEKAVEGINLCFQNAQSLFEDGKILAQNGKNIRAAFLFLSCLEESSKPNLLVLIHRTPEEQQSKRKARWDGFYNHQYKYGTSVARRYVLQGKSIPEVIKLANKAMEAGNILSAAREDLLYVGFDRAEVKWTPPSQIDSSGVSELMTIAFESLEKTQKFLERGLFSEKALNISKQHYEDLEKKLPEPSKITDDDIEKSDVLRLHREFFEKLKVEGIYKPE